MRKCTAWPRSLWTDFPLTRGRLDSHWKASWTRCSLAGTGVTLPAFPSIRNPRLCAVLHASNSSWTIKPIARKRLTAESFAFWTFSASMPATFKLSAYGSKRTSPEERSGQGFPSTKPNCDWYWWTLCDSHIAQLQPIGTTRSMGYIQPSSLTRPPCSAPPISCLAK